MKWRERSGAREAEEDEVRTGYKTEQERYIGIWMMMLVQKAGRSTLVALAEWFHWPIPDQRVRVYS